MLKTGAEHLESLRDGRQVFIGSERVDDVTAHPAFRNAARTVAAIYDMKGAPENHATLTFEENGERYSNYFIRARSTADLEARFRVHEAIADLTYGMFGRSPDHVSSFVTGMTLKPELFGRFEANIMACYERMRRDDSYAVYAVVPPQSARDPEFYQQRALPVPSLQVVREDDNGVVISGMKMLATGAVFANEIWIGNLLPLAPGLGKQAITCVVPCNAQGLKLWSRKAFERQATSDFENPLAYRYDETDSMLLCDEVKVPWEHVFVHEDTELARAIYTSTGAHAYGNHQSNVRFVSKMRLIAGLAHRVTEATGANQIPAVREVLGRLAAWEATLRGLVVGQIHQSEEWPNPGFRCCNRQFVYAALNWCTENHSAIIDQLRELSGGSVFQMPADISVMASPEQRAAFETYWDTPQMDAVERMKLFKLVWEMVGSEFAGRHQQYEKFYAGASFVIRNYNYINADWEAMKEVSGRLLGGYGVPEDYLGSGK